MTVVQAGSYNVNAVSAPGVVVQILPPNQTLINGVPTNVTLFVGTSIFGPKNSPKRVSSIQQYVQQFGQIQTAKYDMGTAVFSASQQGANNFLCVRVTDGTDLASSALILDTQTPSSVPGILLTALYTGTLGNQLQAIVSNGSKTNSYKITISLPNVAPETFDNIIGTGATFWQNAVSAINLGQSGIRGPSNLVIASVVKGVASATITNPGSYTTIPTLTATGGGGVGATLAPIMKAIAISVASGGTGYVVGDKINLAGGTSTTPIAITVATVSSGAVTTFTIDNAGQYTVLPSNPISQLNTTGVGTGATFNVSGWGIDSVNITNSGTGYTNPALAISGSGGGAGTLTVGSALPPSLSTYILSGGTNGNSGVISSTLIGNDSATPRTGMYSGRNTDASLGVLVDCDDSTTFTTQVIFGLQEGIYMIGTGPAGQSISAAISAKAAAGIDSYAMKIMTGDWCYWFDQTNNQTRLISPQGFVAGRLANLSPENSSLNKPIYGIIATQKSSANEIYTTADITDLVQAGIDVIANPSPGGNYFSDQTGENTSSNLLTDDDNYTRMTNFLAFTINKSVGPFIGRLQTQSVRLEAKNAIQSFLQALSDAEMIGDVNGGPAYRVILDSSNNPSNLVALGIMQAYVQIVSLRTIRTFLVNLENGDVSLEASLPLAA